MTMTVTKISGTKMAGISFRAKLVSCLVLAALADFLFFDHPAGWTYGLFGGVVIMAVLLHNPTGLKSDAAKILLFLSLGQCIALIKEANMLSLTLVFLSISGLGIICRRTGLNKPPISIRTLLSFLFSIRFIPRIINTYRRARQRTPSPYTVVNFFWGWFLPLFLACVFLLLFSQANPLVSQWLERLDFYAFLDFFPLSRLLFWLWISVTVFLIIRPAFGKKRPARPTTKHPSVFAGIFSRQAVLRSLVIFNIMFAAQTVMDIAYLSQGWALPEGISYAQYAHEGAYPLIFTALLAGIFVVIAQRCDTEISRSKAIRTLIYLWIGQNIMLVFSAIFRNLLYVEVYSLTYLRLAAFIWMGLVAGGLGWLILRMVLDKSEAWLVNAIMLMLFAVLYASSFINFGGMIAQYNISHARELTGKGPSLDFYYLEELGPSTIPALKLLQNEERVETATRQGAKDALKRLQAKLQSDMQDWRRWTYQDYRLLKSSEKEQNLLIEKSGWQLK